MSLNVLVVDDEALARDRLLRMLREGNSEMTVDVAVNGLEALRKIKAAPPDILFLDIQMPGMTGFDVLQNLEKRPFEIIFQTAYDQYALRAFEESACDYLLKPFESARLQKALEKAKSRLQSGAQVERLESVLKKDDHFLQRIAVRQGDKSIQLAASEIVCFSSQDHYTCVFTAGREYVIDLTLSYLEERLDKRRFFRCHRSHIVALDQITALKLGPQMKAICKSGLSVEVSRQNRARIRELLHSPEQRVSICEDPG